MDIKLMPEKYKRKEEAGPSQLISQLTSRANLWLILSVSLLIVVILGGFGLWAYKDSLIKQKDSLTKQLADLQTQRDLEWETNFIKLKEGIENFKNISKNHLYPSELFKMLEELTLSQVQFSDLSADLLQSKLILKAEAVDYNTLAKQIVVFEQDKRIKKVEVSGVELESSGRVVSNLNIELESSFLRP